ncbi:substrate-binding periplasmic protein [Vibrio hepatarius]|uniref:substrate-binding periplasmic protein n=1 Tax=Vibrio hepatarius TaxID=171383 RepID=UPI001C095277|nr:transporter substrate-binding domain-containing protein [Vibrio hepatarius]MBU2897892.1 transporter substrate-binding domain-containing protein [Vibrio hepatarius]
MEKIIAITVTLMLVSFQTYASNTSFLTFEFPPFSHKIKGQPSGPFTDMVNDVCLELGNECSFKTFPTRRAKLMISEGKADGIYPFAWYENRAEKFYFSVPFMMTEYGIFLSVDNKTTIANVEDLQGLHVGVFGPSNTSNSLDELNETLVAKGLKPMKIMIQRDESGNLIRMLDSNRIDAYYSNRSLGEFRAKQFGIEGIRYTWKDKRLLYFVAFPKSTTDIEFVEKFNKAALKIFSKQGYLESKLNPWAISSPPLTAETLNEYAIPL